MVQSCEANEGRKEGRLLKIGVELKLKGKGPTGTLRSPCSNGDMCGKKRQDMNKHNKLKIVGR
jgi:hypothetical protein